LNPHAFWETLAAKGLHKDYFEFNNGKKENAEVIVDGEKLDTQRRDTWMRRLPTCSVAGYRVIVAGNEACGGMIEP
jgi:hypothetical protein